MQDAVSHNRRAWDRMASAGQRFTTPARDEQIKDPLGELDPRGWMGADITDREVLCLGSGGGRQSALFAAAGARVTVVDISPAMLALDRQVATERGYDIRTVESSIDDLRTLPAAAYEFVSQPVSTCYVPDCVAVYRAVARVIRPGGLYISQHKQPASLQCSTQPVAGAYTTDVSYYTGEPLPQVEGSQHREFGTLEFLHRLEDLVGGLCREGFVIEDLVEPFHADLHAVPGTFAHRSIYLPPYVRIKARRTATAMTNQLWTPATTG